MLNINQLITYFKGIMGRPLKQDVSPDGSVTVRATFGARTWRLIQARARKFGIQDHVCAAMFLHNIEALLHNGVTNWLPSDWQFLNKELQRATNYLPPSLDGVDLTKLHRSNKTKSGFVGVYANGQGFRATGRRGEYLGTFDTAEEAAVHRFRHYKQNKLPYGELEIEVDERRNRYGETGTDEEVIRGIMDHAARTNQTHVFQPWLDAMSDPPPKPSEAEIAALEARMAKLKAFDKRQAANEKVTGGRWVMPDEVDSE